MNQMTDFLEHKSITPALSDYIIELYLKEVLEKSKNVHKIEDDRYTKVISHSKSRFSSSLQPNEILSLEFKVTLKLFINVVALIKKLNFMCEGNLKSGRIFCPNAKVSCPLAHYSTRSLVRFWIPS